VPPLVESLAVDRLADLLGARGTYAAPGLVEADALRLEVEPAVLEDASHAAFQVLDHILVMHAQDAPGRQHTVPVAHELEVGAVVARDVVDAIGELLALREQLLEIAEAAGHRLAPCIDDAGIRQHQVDEPEVAEVVRHLVDEERSAGAIDA